MSDGLARDGSQDVVSEVRADGDHDRDAKDDVVSADVQMDENGSGDDATSHE